MAFELTTFKNYWPYWHPRNQTIGIAFQYGVCRIVDTFGTKERSCRTWYWKSLHLKDTRGRRFHQTFLPCKKLTAHCIWWKICCSISSMTQRLKLSIRISARFAIQVCHKKTQSIHFWDRKRWLKKLLKSTLGVDFINIYARLFRLQNLTLFVVNDNWQMVHGVWQTATALVNLQEF